MNGASAHPVGTAQPWKQFYRAALLEKDPDRLPLLIDQAEKAIVVRARELFQASGDNGEEQEALGTLFTPCTLFAARQDLPVHYLRRKGPLRTF